MRSSAAQVVPFSTGSADSLTIAMWVQYTQQDEGGIFFTAYGVRYDIILKFRHNAIVYIMNTGLTEINFIFSNSHIALNRRTIIQAHSNGVQVSLFPELQDVYLSFGEFATVNDGQWHHVALVWDGSNGGELTLITEGLIASKLEGYGSGKTLPQ